MSAPPGVIFTQLAAGSQHTCGLGSDTKAYCWGNGSSGRLGNVDSANQSSPVPVSAPYGVTFTHLTAGSEHTCGLGSDTVAYCWGRNNTGQLGAHYGDDQFSPEAVAAGPLTLARLTATQLTAGSGHTCGLGTDTRAYCWGRNNARQVGDLGTFGLNTGVPGAVFTPAGVTFTQLAAGGEHTCGLGSNAKVYCWGGRDWTGHIYPWGVDPRAVEVPTGPQSPTGVTVTPGDRQITVSWTAPADLDHGSLTGYTATASSGNTCTTTTTTCTITGLSNGSNYLVWVTASTTAGTSDASAPSEIVVPIAPPAGPQPPTGVTVTAGDQRVLVSWTAGDLGAGSLTGYTAIASPGGSSCTTITTTCMIIGLDNGSAYSVTVTASTTAGTSDPSSPSEPVTPRADPVADDRGPLVTVTPNNRALVRGTHFTTTVNATDPAGISRSYLAGADGVGRPHSYTSARLTTGVDGNRTFTWIVLDKRGNQTATSRTVTVDNTRPTVAFRKAPNNGAKVSKSTVLTATASDRNGIARVQLMVDGKEVANDALPAYAFTLNPTRYGKRFTVGIRAYDRAGNVSSTSQRTYRR